MNPKYVIRYINYVFLVLETVMEHCKLSRLCNIGDTFGVYGTELSESDMQHAREISYQEHSMAPCMRVAKYGSIACLLSSEVFAHFPERARFFKDAFKDRLRTAGKNKPFEFPQIRFGCHNGTVSCGIVDTGKAPKFDLFGISVALAARMCATGAPEKIHLTSMMKDAIEAEESKQAVSYIKFDDPRKTIVRGQGTITSFFIHSTAFEVPTALLGKLGIERAAIMAPFETKRHDILDANSSVSSKPSFHSSVSDNENSVRSGKKALVY